MSPATSTSTVTRQRADIRAMSVLQFCARYGVGRSTVYEQIRLGKLTIRKCGGRSLIACDDAERWLAALPASPAVDAGMVEHVDGGQQ